jgi:hypothetical protein
MLAVICQRRRASTNSAQTKPTEGIIMKVAMFAALAALIVIGISEPVFAHTLTIHKGQTMGPLHVTNPPTDKVVNNGTITNRGHKGVPALKTSGSVTVINNGTITATSSNGKGAVGLQMGP